MPTVPPHTQVPLILLLRLELPTPSPLAKQKVRVIKG